jgi:uncharacterized membrane protein YoaT (DUF817 family)
MIAATQPIVLKDFIREFFWFGIKQGWACLFGGAMLATLLATRLYWDNDWPVARYDFLFFYALAIQFLLVAFKLESAEEVKVIFVFHVVGTVMELFKTHMGCWEYPEHNLIRIGEVPLFSGFMYSAVGSYIARVWRIFHFRFENYPRLSYTVILCALIYINFFTHHYMIDFRPALFAVTFALFFRTRIYFKPDKMFFRMPLLLGWLLVSLFIWIAENFGTLGRVWVYPNQHQAWHFVSPEKIGSWFLLMIISFVLVTLLHRDALEGQPAPMPEAAPAKAS